MNIIFLGAPGSGKGTHAKKVMEHYGIPHISTGDILRANIKAGTELGVKAKSFIDAGQLVPDSLVIDIVRDRLEADDCKKGYILDGFPRTIPQADALAEFTKIDLVINLIVSDDVILHRIMGRRMCRCGESYHIDFLNGRTTCAKCGEPLYIRDDDREDVVKSRLEVYYKQTQPLIDYYAKKGVLVDIDGATGIDNVFIDIVETVDRLGK